MSCVSSGKYTQNFTYFTQVATVIRHQAASPPNIDRSTVLIKAHRFLGTHECALLSQTASRSIQPFLWDSRCAQHADTQTSDRATKFCSSRLRLLRPDDAAWSFSQHMNWTQLAWKNKSTQLHQSLIGHAHSPVSQRHHLHLVSLLGIDWLQVAEN